MCENKNRLARCDQFGKAGHQHARDSAHSLKIDPTKLKATYSVDATPAERAGLVKEAQLPNKAQAVERGGKGGKGGRGRGRGRGRAGEHFGQPPLP